MTTPQGNWNYPTTIRFGAGRISELPAVCRELDMANPLIVTDEGLAGHPMVQSAADGCSSAGIRSSVFGGVKPNPTGENVTSGVTAFNDGGHDGVIALGGGSSLDAGKAIAFMAGQTRPLWDFEDIGDNWTRADLSKLPPVLAVPTTSGTGSEVGRASVITDAAARVKRIIFHPRMLPDIVIADPELTLSLPQSVTAACGMDALSHNLEAFFAPSYHPMARGIAVEGIRLVKQWLPAAVNEGTDITARAHMLAASQAGATSFQRGLGAMHALAHPLGARYDAHHGLLNAILMPYVLSANGPAIEADAQYLARCLDLSGGFDAVLAWVVALREEIGIPNDLASIDIDATDAALIGKMASEDPTAGTNPVPFDEAQYTTLFEHAVRGTLPGAL